MTEFSKITLFITILSLLTVEWYLTYQMKEIGFIYKKINGHFRKI